MIIIKKIIIKLKFIIVVLIIVCIKLLKKEGVRNLVRNMFLEVIMKLVGNKNVNLGGI